MQEFDKVYSPTWPFETKYDDVPQRLFADAHIVGADECSITDILVSGGVITVLAKVYYNSETIYVSSGVVSAERGTKVRLYNAVGKCFGWILLGYVIPDTLTISDVEYKLCMATCIPFEAPGSATENGMTGDWTVVGANGVTIDHTTTAPLNISFSADENSFTVQSPDALDKASGNGIYSINGINAGTITISITNGKAFPKLESGKLREIVFVPPLTFHWDKPDGTLTNTTEFPNIVTDHTWNDGSYGLGNVVEHNGAFRVTYNNVVTEMEQINTIQVNMHGNVKMLDLIEAKWAGCDLSDYFRTIIKSRYEVPTSYPLPLDPIITGQ